MVHCSLSIPIAIPNLSYTLNQKLVKANRTNEIYRERERRVKKTPESWASAAEAKPSSALMEARGLSGGCQHLELGKWRWDLIKCGMKWYFWFTNESCFDTLK